jgi:HSP20 family protein
MKGIVPWRRNQESALSTSNADPFELLHREVDELFDRFAGGMFGTAPWRSSEGASVARHEPRVDFTETDKAYELSAELPGVEEKDLNLTIDENILTIKAEQSHQEERKEKNYHIMERSSGSYQRTLQIPGDVDHDKIKAKFKNGVLSLTLPKNPELSSKKRTIAIEG